jgi:hypothetical protein
MPASSEGSVARTRGVFIAVVCGFAQYIAALIEIILIRIRLISEEGVVV